VVKLVGTNDSDDFVAFGVGITFCKGSEKASNLYDYFGSIRIHESEVCRNLIKLPYVVGNGYVHMYFEVSEIANPYSIGGHPPIWWCSLLTVARTLPRETSSFSTIGLGYLARFVQAPV